MSFGSHLARREQGCSSANALDCQLLRNGPLVVKAATIVERSNIAQKRLEGYTSLLRCGVQKVQDIMLAEVQGRCREVQGGAGAVQGGAGAVQGGAGVAAPSAPRQA